MLNFIYQSEINITSGNKIQRYMKHYSQKYADYCIAQRIMIDHWDYKITKWIKKDIVNQCDIV